MQQLSLTIVKCVNLVLPLLAGAHLAALTVGPLWGGSGPAAQPLAVQLWQQGPLFLLAAAVASS